MEYFAKKCKNKIEIEWKWALKSIFFEELRKNAKKRDFRPFLTPFDPPPQKAQKGQKGQKGRLRLIW
jgi:hypothetical protein